MEQIKLPIVLKKPRGRQYIHIDVDEDMDDDWFIRVSYRNNKTNEEASGLTIIRKDLDGWISRLKRQKYEIQDEENSN